MHEAAGRGLSLLSLFWVSVCGKQWGKVILQFCGIRFAASRWQRDIDGCACILFAFVILSSATEDKLKRSRQIRLCMKYPLLLVSVTRQPFPRLVLNTASSPSGSRLIKYSDAAHTHAHNQQFDVYLPVVVTTLMAFRGDPGELQRPHAGVCLCEDG